jgi:NifB/MoaA-like Fe-S oxidoreductase
VSESAESPTESVPRKIGITLLTGEYGARVLAPVADDLAAAAGAPVRVVPVANRFFGGNIAVTGLLTGADVARAVDAAPAGERILLPDVVLSNGRFLDGTTPEDLPRPVEIVETDGASLVRALRS